MVHHLLYVMALGFLYRQCCLFVQHLEGGERLRRWLHGALFGLMAAWMIVQPAVTYPGDIRVDGRSAFILTSFLFNGPVGGLITTLIALAARAPLGGMMLAPGLLEMVLTALWGAYLWRRWRERLPLGVTYVEFFLAALVTILLTILAGWLFVPPDVMPVPRWHYGLIAALFPVLVWVLAAIVRAEHLNRLNRDAIARHQAQQNVRIDQFRSLADNLPFMVARLDLAGRVRFVNRVSYDGWAESNEVYIGKRIADMAFLPPEIAERVQSLIDQALASGHKQRYEYSFVGPEGRTYYQDAHIIPEFDAQGKLHSLLAVSYDVTDLIEALEKLRQIEARQRALLQAIPDTLVINRIDGTYEHIRLSPALHAQPKIEDWTGKTLHEVYPPERADEALANLRHVAATGDMLTLNTPGHPNLDQPTTFEARLVKLDDERVMTLIRDITEQRRTERALRESEARNRAILQALPDSLIITDANDVYEDFIPAQARAHTLRAEERIGQHTRDVLPPGVAEQALAVSQRARETGDMQTWNYERTHADGQTYILEARVVPMAAGRLLILVRDITEPTRLQNELRASEAQNRALLEAIPDTLIISCADGTYERVRPVAPFDKVIPAEWEGQHLSDRLPPEQADIVQQAIQETLLTGQPQTHEYPVTLPETGETFIVEARFVKLDETRVMRLIRDITEDRKAEARQLDLRLKEEKLNIINRFMVDIGHDFRTPLSVITTSLHLLRHPNTTAEGFQRHTQRIEKQTLHIADLLDKMLLMVRLDTVGVQAPDLIHLNTLLREIETATADRLERAGLHLDLQTPDDLPHLNVNANDLFVALREIIDNAITYSPPDGTLHLSVTRHTNEVIISVRDFGPGMAEAVRQQAIEPFFRGDPSRPTYGGGSGLGLSIAQKIVQQFGGRFWLENVAPGLRVNLSLPV